MSLLWAMALRLASAGTLGFAPVSGMMAPLGPKRASMLPRIEARRIPLIQRSVLTCRHDGSGGAEYIPGSSNYAKCLPFGW